MAESENILPAHRTGGNQRMGPTSLAAARNLAMALVVALGLMAAFTHWDRSRREALEAITEPTAAGDMQFVPAGEDVERPLGTYQGRTLFGDSVKKLDDSKMLKAGTDDSGSFAVYRLDPKKAEKSGADPDALYLKTAANRYIKTRRK